MSLEITCKICGEEFDIRHGICPACAWVGDRTKTGPEYGEQVMVKLEDGYFKCDCGCNVFTRLRDTSSFICNSCKSYWKGKPYCPFVKTEQESSVASNNETSKDTDAGDKS